MSEPYLFPGSDIKTNGFSKITCHNMVQLLDVSFSFFSLRKKGKHVRHQGAQGDRPEPWTHR